MKNKKAILVDEVLRMLIAVAVIIILIILATKLYGIFTTKSDLEQAKSTLKEIKVIVERLKEGESEEYFLLSPHNWIVVELENKLCLCSPKRVKSLFNEHRLNQDCEELSFCEDINVLIDSVCYKGDKYTHFEGITIPSCILVDLEKIFIIKESGGIIIKSTKTLETEEIFEESLDFKGDSDDSILELSTKLMNNDFDKKYKSEIKVLLEKFFKDSDKTWIFQICDALYNNEGKIYTSWKSCEIQIDNIGSAIHGVDSESLQQKIVLDKNNKKYVIQLSIVKIL